MSLKSILSSKLLFFGILFLVLILALVSLALFFFVFKKGVVNSSDYSAIYLETGDIYFGKLSYFPSLSLSNVWYLKREPNGELSLQRFKESAWGPEDKLKINRDKVVWIAKVSPSSQLISIMEGIPLSNLPAGGSSSSNNSNLPNPSNPLPFEGENNSESTSSPR
ncbi:MAG: otopetrin domain-containing protein [Patescibacteria group bacterium]|nr:otopetrin domain-containing protein [Patescibacteria group bacterium]